MPIYTSHAPGTFCWADLATTDTAGAKRFYGELFGWGSHDVTAGSEVVYALFSSHDKEVAGLGGLMPEQLQQGVPPHWMAYVATADVERTATDVQQLGGGLIVPPMEVMDAGRMLMLRDPEGAIVAAWQPGNHIGFGRRDELNSLCWVELAVRNPDKAGPFYQKLFGWDAETMPMASGPYTMFKAGDTSVGGMWQIPGNMPDIPPHWMVYFAVADCDAAVQKALALGGGVILPATDIPNIGRFATLKDPQGAVFSVIKLEG